MLRFLRRYNRVLLVVGGSFLMVVFLLPTVPHLGANPVTQTVAHIDGRAITLGDVRQAVEELGVVAAVAPEVYSALGFDDKHPEHWLLLTSEARKAGLIGGVRDGRTFVEESARLGYELGMIDAYRNNDYQTLSRMQQDRAGWLADRLSYGDNARLRAAMSLQSERTVDLALAKLRGVIRLIESNNTASVFSTREAAEMARRVADTASIGVVIVHGAAGAADLPPPDEAALQSHFEKYKSQRPQTDPLQHTTDNPLGIGYLQAPAIKLERLSIDRSRLMAAYQPDPIEVNKFWQQNRARYPGEFAAERSRVENDYKSQQVSAIFERAADALRRELFRATSALPVDPVVKAYKLLPSDWPERMPTLQSLADVLATDLSKEYQVSGFTPEVVVSDGAWKTFTELRDLPGIGRATLKVSENQAIQFPDLVMTVKELGGTPRFGIQKGMIHGPVRELNGGLHYYRILDARPQGPPASLDEVREKVVADLRLQQGMDRLKDQAENYRQRLAQGLQGLANEVGTTVEWGLEVSPRVVRSGPGGTEDRRLNVPEFRDAVIEAARKLDATRPAEEQDASLRTIARIVPTADGVVVAQITGWRPMTVERFLRSATDVRSLANSEAAVEGGAMRAFSLERLAERLKYEPVGRDGDAAKPPAPAPDQPASTPPAPAGAG